MSNGAAYQAMLRVEKQRDDLAEKLRDLQSENDALKKERDHLLERQDAHLRLISHMSTESINEKEANELRGQMAALIAEVGTLRSRVEELEKKR